MTAFTEATAVTASFLGEDQRWGGGGDYSRVSRSQLVTIVAVAVLMWSNLLVLAANSKLSATPSRLYMSALAVTDLVICTVYTLRLALAWIWGSAVDPACYIAMGLVFLWALLYSLLLLQITAIDRYIAVCRPTSKLLTTSRVRKLLVATAILAAIQLAVQYQIALFYSRWVSDLIGLTVWTVTFLCMCVLYVRIGIELFRRAHMRKKIGVGSYSAWSTSGHGHSVQAGSSNQELSQHAHASTTPRQSGNGQEIQTNFSKTMATGRSVPTVTPKGANMRGHMTKTGLMLLVITVIFFACWAPYWLSILEVNVPPLLVDVFIVNSVVNPAIYSVLSKSFRKRALNILICGRGN